MSTPPTPIINLDSPKEIYDVDDIQWNHDSTESAKNGTIQEWITEPLQMLTSASPASSQSTNSKLNPSLSAPAANEDDSFAASPASSNGTDQLLPLTTNGQSQLASVPTSNGLPMIPTSSNGYHQAYSVPATTSGHQLIPGSSNGHHYHVPAPGISNGVIYGVNNHGVHYTCSNGVIGYPPNMNGVHMMNARPTPTNIVHPFRHHGGYNLSILNGTNGYVNGMANGRFVRPGWITTTTNKVVNGVKKQKRNRTAFTSQQMMELEQEYGRTRYLDRNRRIELSEALNLNQRTIKIWFQNRRMKEKKDRLEEEVTTSDSPPENINDLPIFVQDGSYVPVGVENGQYNPALYAENLPMPSMSQMMPVPVPQIHQAPEMPYLVENSIQPYNIVHANGVPAPQPPMVGLNGAQENAPGANAEENWDLSWIRSINISDDIELA